MGQVLYGEKYNIDLDLYSNAKISDLGFSNRTINVLARNNIFTVSDLLKTSSDKLSTLSGVGVAVRDEICVVLQSLCDINTVNCPQNIGDTKTPLYQIFGIDSEMYNGFSIDEMGYSIRTRNALKNHKIMTVEELLNYNIDNIKKIRNLGAKSFDEIYESFLFLDKKITPDKVITKALSKPKTLSEGIKKYQENIFSGDFSFLEDVNLSSDEIETGNSLKMAYEDLGGDFVALIKSNPSTGRLIKDVMFSFSENYILKESYKNEIKVIVEKDLNVLSNLNVNPFHNIYNLNLQNKKVDFLDLDDKTTFATLHECVNYSDYGSHNSTKLFLEFCQKDINALLDDIFFKLFTHENTKVVIYNRSQGKTLEDVGCILGVTRERVRQLEQKSRRKFVMWNNKHCFVEWISALNNGTNIVTSEMISDVVGDKKDLVIFFLRDIVTNFRYDKNLAVFVSSNSGLSEELQKKIDSLPQFFLRTEFDTYVHSIASELSFSCEIIEQAILKVYQLTGDVYHRGRLLTTDLYDVILNDDYKSGISVYDDDVIDQFREKVYAKFGKVNIPEHNRALASRLIECCVLCGRGRYKPRKEVFISPKTLNKILKYIDSSKEKIFLMHTLFTLFQDELIKDGIDNRFYLQGILHQECDEKYFFTRDYLSKDSNLTSIYDEIVKYIKTYKYPVSKSQIFDRFPGVTEIMVAFAVEDERVLNYFGEYLHVERLQVEKNEKEYILKLIKNILSDDKVHHIKEIYDLLMKEKPEVLTRNYAMHPYASFSLLQSLFGGDFNFLRPFVAKPNIYIDTAIDRLHDLVYSKERVNITEISEFVKNNSFQIQSILEFINSCNDEYLLIDANTLMRISSIGINKETVAQIEDVILNQINEIIPIRELSVAHSLPKLNVPWTDWLIYSALKKWGENTEVATSSNQFRLSVPLVSPIGKCDSSIYKEIERDANVHVFGTDDLSDIDSLLEDMIDENFLLDT